MFFLYAPQSQTQLINSKLMILIKKAFVCCFFFVAVYFFFFNLRV